MTLTAPLTAGGNNFGGWSGCDSSSETTCNVTMGADRPVTATFVAPLSLGALSLPDAEIGVSYSAPLVTGGAPPYTFTLVRGIFPPGLDASPVNNGLLTGTPDPPRGRSFFTVDVTDQIGFSVTGRFRIKVRAALQIGTTALKTGTAGKNYKTKLKATGGKKPYAWSLVSGDLSGLGLSLDVSTGRITGIPTQAGGPANFTFRVTDPVGGAFQKDLALTID